MTLDTFLLALGLLFAIEGALYGLFPDAMRKAMASLLAMPSDRLRITGLGLATAGVTLIWLVRQML
jgi:uncharacterized protein YjeT (DUF2065 family)